MKKIILISLFILLIPVLVFSTFEGKLTNISEGGDHNCIVPRMTIDKWGNIHVVWEEYVTAANNEIFYRKYGINGLSERINISKNSWPSREPDVAVDENGNVYIVWMDTFNTSGFDFSIAFREIDKNGEMSEIKKVIPNFGSNYRLPSIASSPEGDISIITYSHNYRVYSAWRDNGKWSKATIINRKIARYAGESASATWSENGKFYGAWPEFNPSTERCMTVYYSSREVGKEWEEPKVVNATGDAQCHPRIRVGDDGTIHIVWMDEEEGAGFDIVYEKWDVDNKTWLMPPIIVSQGGSSNNLPTLTITEDNEIYVAWSIGHYGRLRNSQYCYKDINGVWSNSQPIKENPIVNPYFTEIESGGPNNNIFFIYATSIKSEGKKEVFLVTKKPIEVMPMIAAPLNVQAVKASSEKINPYWDTESYVISWDKNDENDENDINIVSYYIYRKIEGERTETKIGEVSSDEFSYVDSNFDVNKTYIYGVSSVDEEGNESSISFDED